MEIVNLINDVYQLIDHNGTVITQGSHTHCVVWLAELCRKEEEGMYGSFLEMAGF